MSIWQQYSEDEKLVMLQQTAASKRIVEQAVEKDWWVSVILTSLSKTSWADFLQFKGGTSLSKAWGLINRFSEDIDLSISRLFFNLPDNTPRQRATIRRKAFHYIEKTLIDELYKMLISNKITDYEIKPVVRNRITNNQLSNVQRFQVILNRFYVWFTGDDITYVNTLVPMVHNNPGHGQVHERLIRGVQQFYWNSGDGVSHHAYNATVVKYVLRGIERLLNDPTHANLETLALVIGTLMQGFNNCSTGVINAFNAASILNSSL